MVDVGPFAARAPVSVYMFIPNFKFTAKAPPD